MTEPLQVPGYVAFTDNEPTGGSMLDSVTDDLLQLRATGRGRRSDLYAYWHLTACSSTCCCVNPFGGGGGSRK